MQMFTDVVIAIDGSKFKAVNSKQNNFTHQAKDHIARVEQSISHYLSELDEADKNAKSDASTKLTAIKLEWLQNRLQESANPGNRWSAAR
jgi:hypothetical protein